MIKFYITVTLTSEKLKHTILGRNVTFFYFPHFFHFFYCKCSIYLKSCTYFGFIRSVACLKMTKLHWLQFLHFCLKVHSSGVAIRNQWNSISCFKPTVRRRHLKSSLVWNPWFALGHTVALLLWLSKGNTFCALEIVSLI